MTKCKPSIWKILLLRMRQNVSAASTMISVTVPWLPSCTMEAFE